MSDSRKSPSRQQTSLFRNARRRKSNPALPGASSANDLMAELTGLSQKIAAHALRVQIGDIVTQARAVMNFLHESTGAPEWRDYVRDCLLSAVDATRPFAARFPHVTEPTDPVVLRFSQFLTALAHTLDNLHAKLTAEPPSNTAGINAYRTTLRQIGQSYREGDSQPE